MGCEKKKKYKFAILGENTNPEKSYKYWIRAIEESGINIQFKVIDLTKSDWLTQVDDDYDIFLLSAPLPSWRLKNLFDERTYVLNLIMKKQIYPTFDAFFVYENKRLLNYYLRCLEIPCPETGVFYDKEEALEYIRHLKHPLVAKTNIGGAGLGVAVLRTHEDSRGYINDAFSKGVRAKTGPDVRKPDLVKRILCGVKKKGYLKQKVTNYLDVLREKQNGFVFLQEFIAHTFEWRCVRIDRSFFAHKKIVNSGMASGYLIKRYENPPKTLLYFVKKISEKLRIYSAAFDIFEIGKDQYLVNEVQTIFGQSDPYQMLVDGKIGRYLLGDKGFVFEEGDFSKNKCYNLRLKHAMKLVNR